MGDLLERDPELQVLATATADAARGSGVVLFVHGEPGIGKTALVRAYLSRLTPDIRTFVGGCDDLITPRALGPFHDAVRWRGGPLADALNSGDRDRVFGAIVEELSHPRDVTVLVVEDVHWADDATLDVLQFVVRRIGTLRAVVVLTYRDDELRDDHPLRSLLGSAAAGSIRRIGVPRLSPSAVRSLSAAAHGDADTVYSVTAGNPFFVTEMLAAGGDLPATVKDAVLARVRQFGEPIRDALEQLSVVPTRVEHSLVEALIGDVEALAEAERRGMLEAGRDHVAFRHELARRAIEESLPQTRRVALNRALVAVLLTRPERDLARIVHHAVEAGDVDTIVAFAPAAGREAARAGSHREALMHFEHVLRYEDRLPPADRARLLEDYAWELYNAHRLRDAGDTAQRSYELWREVGDQVPMGIALVTLSRLRWIAGDTAAAWTAIEAATELLDRTDDVAARAHAHTYRGAQLALHGEVGRALPQLDHAQALAEAAGADSLVALCLNYRGVCALTMGDGDEAVRLEQESLARAIAAHDGSRRRELGENAGEHIVRAYNNLCATLHLLERYEELDEVIAEGLRYAYEVGFTLHAYNMQIRRCAVLIHRGSWDEAEQALTELDGAVEDPGVLGRWMIPMFGRLLARRGHAAAEQVLARALQYPDASAVPVALDPPAVAYLEWAWLTGRPERAASRLADCLAQLRPDRDGRILGELLRYAQRAGLAEGGAFDGCPEPWASALNGDRLAAAAYFHRAGDEYERALELAESGDIETTTAALGILDRLGADAAAELVRRRLREMGATRVPRGPAPATRGNPAGLTDRQIDVLRLLREGLTNAEIADRLVLSVRTVDHHVAAILVKLEVTSRRDAARRAAELGIG
jgi:DNA-binding CsgD family transcriptional regulator/tetratricopeptide (TPR) repeat protein